MEAERRPEAHRPQHPEVVLAEPRVGVAYRADDLSLQVLLAADVVEQLALDGLVKHPVYREVPPQRILARAGVLDPNGPPAVLVLQVRAKCRHLEREAGRLHDDDAELLPDRGRLGE